MIKLENVRYYNYCREIDILKERYNNYADFSLYSSILLFICLSFYSLILKDIKPLFFILIPFIYIRFYILSKIKLFKKINNIEYIRDFSYL